jgi:hypothetical protein
MEVNTMIKYTDYDVKDILKKIRITSERAFKILEYVIENFGLDNSSDLYNLTNLVLHIQKLNDLVSSHEYTDYVQSLIIQPEGEYEKEKIS